MKSNVKDHELADSMADYACNNPEEGGFTYCLLRNSLDAVPGASQQ